MVQNGSGLGGDDAAPKGDDPGQRKIECSVHEFDGDGGKGKTRNKHFFQFSFQAKSMVYFLLDSKSGQIRNFPKCRML